MRTAISFEGLDQLGGEVLPERTVLSTLVTPFNNPGAGDTSSSSAAAAGGSGGGDHGTTAMSACQSTWTGGTGGLIGALGLGTPPSSSVTCTPAAMSTH